MAGATRSYLIPIGDLSLGDRQDMRANADQNLGIAAQRLAIRDLLSDLIIRDSLPDTDFGLAATRDYLVAGPGVAGVELQYIGFAVPVDHVNVLWGCAINSATPSLSVLRLTLGATSSQVRGVFQVEKLEPRLEPVGYFSEAIIFTRQEFQRLMVMPKLAFGANGQRLILAARTIEPIGTTVSAPSA